MRSAIRSRALVLTGAATTLALALAVMPGGIVATADVGYRDYNWQASDVNGPTAEKPQSKLWYVDGTWWGNLFDPATGYWEIYRLAADQTWVTTGTRVDNRDATWADALWDGGHLYVASAGRDPANTGDSARLYRFSYDTSAKTWSPDTGFPVDAVSGGMEAIVMDKDSTGRLWMTYTRNSQVWVNHTAGDDRTWGTPFVLPVRGVNVSPDDISAVVAFGDRMGVMWSNQIDDAIYFAEHLDSAGDTTWIASRTALVGPKSADDHVALRSIVRGPTGDVYAVTKTSLNDLANPNPNAPLIMLLVRNGDGSWSNTPVSTVADDQTRPTLMIDGDTNELYVFATTPIGGGTINSGTAETAIFYKATSLSSIAFEPGQGTPFIENAADLEINNAASTKQVVTSTSGLVVLASDNSTKDYLHNLISLNGTGASPSPSGAGSPSPTVPPSPSPPSPTPSATPSPTVSPSPTPARTKKPHPHH